MQPQLCQGQWLLSLRLPTTTAELVMAVSTVGVMARVTAHKFEAVETTMTRVKVAKW